MNERIKELWNQSRYPSGRGHDEEKFAELIVQECVGRIKLQHQMDEITDDWVYNTIQTDLREHFGVE